MTWFKDVRYYDGDRLIEHASVAVAGTKIAKVQKGDAFPREPGCGVIDGAGRLLVPGYIDIHLHGCGGYDVMDATPEALMGMSRLLAENGTTSFLPSTVTMDSGTTRKAIETVRTCMGRAPGANILGVHLEGPFINAARKGAQNEKYIQTPSVAHFNALVENDLTAVRRVTLAPEMGEGLALTRYLARKGICVSAGHTCASAAVMRQGIEAGLSLCTHLFNGMNPMHHRDPGVVGTALLRDDIYAEFIADLVHLDRDILALIVKAKGADRCILITDSLSAACLGDGSYNLGGQNVIVKDGVARIENGSIAGSVITMKQAVRNMVRAAGVELSRVIRMAALNPARVIGLDGCKGLIKEGYDADLNLLDNNLDVVTTMVMGKVIE